MSDSAANAWRDTYLAKHATPRALPPENYTTDSAEDGLFITLYGYALTTRNKYVTPSRAEASTQVDTIVGAAEFVTADIIEKNTLDYTIDDYAPIRALEALDDICLAGDASGNRWIWGVYGTRGLQYSQAPDQLSYRLTGGRLFDVNGHLVNGWEATPGYCLLEDMPGAPDPVNGVLGDNPRVIYIEEFTWDAAEWLNGKQAIRFLMETR
jgi:hypothetical protein